MNLIVLCRNMKGPVLGMEETNNAEEGQHKSMSFKSFFFSSRIVQRDQTIGKQTYVVLKIYFWYLIFPQ